MNIKELRDKTKLSQRAFGKILGLSPQSILNYEQGSNVPETVKKLIQYEFAEYLPEEEQRIAESSTNYPKEPTNEVKRLQQRIAELEEMNEELKKDKEDLKRDKQMLQLHIETLTTGPADKKRSV